jgi:hypothetical protein
MKRSNSIWYIIGILFGIFSGLLIAATVFSMLFGFLTFFLVLSGFISVDVSLAVAGIVAILVFLGTSTACIIIARKIGNTAQSIQIESEKRWYQRSVIMLLIGIVGLLAVVSVFSVRRQQIRKASQQYDIERTEKLIHEERKQQINQVNAEIIGENDIVIQLDISGESEGSHILSLDIADTLYHKNLYSFEDTIRFSEGANTFEHIVKLHTIAQAYHENVINNRTLDYGLQNEEMNVTVTLVSIDRPSVPSTATASFTVSYHAADILKTE